MEICSSRAIHAAVAADWPNIMNVGSIRTEPYAMCDADMHTGTNKLEHSDCRGTIER